MKTIRLILFSLLVTFSFVANGQTLAIGEKAPDIKIKEWVKNKPSSNNITLINFLSYNGSSLKTVEDLDAVISKIEGKINLVIIHREPKDKIAKTYANYTDKFYFGIDEAGKNFSAFGAQYIPFSVLLDVKGRVVWQGNTSKVTEDIFKKINK